METLTEGKGMNIPRLLLANKLTSSLDFLFCFAPEFNDGKPESLKSQYI